MKLSRLRLYIFTLTLCLGLSCCFSQKLLAQEKKFDEYQVKTAYLYNFLRFISWPEDVEQPEIIIGILGKKPSASLKTKLAELQKKSIRDKPIQIIFFKNLNKLKDHQPRKLDLLFVLQDSKDINTQVINYLVDQPVLTIGEVKDFASHGGIISFVKKDQRILFDINLLEADKRKLRIPSKLQRIANYVYR